MIDEEGKPMSFAEVVSALLVEEFGKTKDEAERLVKKHTNIVVRGVMANMNHRATAMAIEMAESK